MQSETIQRYLNQKVKIFLNHNNKQLVFTATILYINNEKVEFIDKYNATFNFPISEVIAIEPLGGIA